MPRQKAQLSGQSSMSIYGKQLGFLQARRAFAAGLKALPALDYMAAGGSTCGLKSVRGEGGVGAAESDIRSLFSAYAAGFDDADAEAVTALFAWPATIWQFGEGHVFEDAEELSENVDALIDVFDEAGIVSTEPEVKDAARRRAERLRFRRLAAARR